MANTSPLSPYGSARDLPSVQKMEMTITGFKKLGCFLRKDQRVELTELQQEHHRLLDMVDKFYGLLGNRNWVFTGDLKPSEMQAVIDTTEPEIAEARLIKYYKEKAHIDFPLGRLFRFEAMRPRMELLENALEDYRGERYYSTVLVLLTVMDGFVNDINTHDRQGLHTRAPEDMVAWDSVVGHHLGLSNAQRSFQKGFYKTELEHTTELHRNGIMHGTLVNFNNEIIATKAWNRLFAVTDWADSLRLRAEAAKHEPRLRDTFKNMLANAKRTRSIERWQPYEYSPPLAQRDLPELPTTCVDFLGSWHKGQWALVGKHFMGNEKGDVSMSNMAIQAKALYQHLTLSDWKLLKVRHSGAFHAEIVVSLTVNETQYRTVLHWIRTNSAGDWVTEGEAGLWRLTRYGPTHFLSPEQVA